jgi:plasmid stability protein
MTMAELKVRNMPAEAHRALRARVAQCGPTMEAEVREILEPAVSPEGRVKLGARHAADWSRWVLSGRITLIAPKRLFSLAMRTGPIGGWRDTGVMVASTSLC